MAYDYQTANPCNYELLKQYANHNRNNPTEAENIIWQCLRANQLGQTFKRQHIIGDFIAAFCCIQSHLIIEIDGGYHGIPEQQISDAMRTQWLNAQGYKVIRFSNEEVIGNTNNILSIIKQNLK